MYVNIVCSVNYDKDSICSIPLMYVNSRYSMNLYLVRVSINMLVCV